MFLAAGGCLSPLSPIWVPHSACLRESGTPKHPLHRRTAPRYSQTIAEARSAHRLILYTSLKLLTETGSSLRPAESKGEDEGSGWTYHFLSESRITSVRLA